MNRRVQFNPIGISRERTMPDASAQSVIGVGSEVERSKKMERPTKSFEPLQKLRKSLAPKT